MQLNGQISSTYVDPFNTFATDLRSNAVFKLPFVPRSSKSVDNSCECSSYSDSSNSDGVVSCKKKRNRSVPPGRLPPLGIFWDIENCQVPKSRRASAVVQRLRNFFLHRFREEEFLVVCDIKKEHPQIIQELHDAQVNLIHVASTSKNAADEKLRQFLRKFGEVYQPPCAVLLISGDINFAADLSDLKYRKKAHVILVHNSNIADAMLLCADEHYLYSSIMEDLPQEKRRERTISDEGAVVEVSNLPIVNPKRIKNRLHLLTDNCGGRVLDIFMNGRALIKFSSFDFALRAQKRIQDEDVFGKKIVASDPQLLDACKLKPEDIICPKPTYRTESLMNLSNVSSNGINQQQLLDVRGMNQYVSAFRPIETSSNKTKSHSNETCVMNYSEIVRSPITELPVCQKPPGTCQKALPNAELQCNKIDTPVDVDSQHFIDRNKHLWSAMYGQAPEPSELPIPIKLISKKNVRLNKSDVTISKKLESLSFHSETEKVPVAKHYKGRKKLDQQYF